MLNKITKLVFCLAFLIPMGIGTMSLAQQTTGEIPTRIVGGHLIVLADLKANGANEEFALFVDLEAPYTLSLVNNAAQRLKLGEGTDDVTIQFTSGLVMTAERDTIVGYPGPLNPNDVIKYHIAEMDERKVAGAIGVGLLKQFKLTLDAANGRMLVAEPAEKSNDLESREGDVVISPIRMDESRTYLPIQYGNGQKTEMVLGTNNYDTYIDSDIASKLGAPAGNIGTVTF